MRATASGLGRPTGVTPLIALFLYRDPDPQAVMQAYWETLGKAKSFHAILRTDAVFTSDTISEIWLEKPSRMRIVTCDSEVRSDGKTVWFINHSLKSYRLGTPTPDDMPAMFEPFFGVHRFDQASLGYYRDMAIMTRNLPPQKQVVVLTRKNAKPGDIRLIISPFTRLPISTQTTADQETFTTRCTTYEIDPKIDFSWPPLTDYRKTG